ncbi:hypothetical protein BCAR13_1920027 [Paraburkholderia caribensis]|nr:hypothetical protein BCAR13_1920027 [Paraburkholderia caribensis]
MPVAPRVKRNKAGLQGRALCHSSGSRANSCSHVILWNGITLLYPKGSVLTVPRAVLRGMTKRSRRTNVSV